MKLTPKQREALLLVYSNGYDLDVDPDFGASPRTVKALLERGYIESEDQSEDPSYRITSEGKEVLGAHWPVSSKPKTIKTALKKAMSALGIDASDASIVGPRTLGKVWYNDDERADFTGALAIVVDAYADDEVEWAAVATMVSEAGFPCYAEQLRNMVAFWPEED